MKGIHVDLGTCSDKDFYAIKSRVMILANKMIKEHKECKVSISGQQADRMVEDLTKSGYIAENKVPELKVS